MVGVSGIAPELLPPQGSGLLLSYTPNKFLMFYFVFALAFMHLAQTKTRLPFGKRNHWRFGYFLFLVVGLYFPRSFLNFQTKVEVLPQIAQLFAIKIEIRNSNLEI